jgi:hypothetical protein
MPFSWDMITWIREVEPPASPTPGMLEYWNNGIIFPSNINIPMFHHFIS